MRKLVQGAARLLRRRHAYRSVFLSRDGGMTRDQELVVADLRRFCRAQASTAMVSPVSKQIDPIAMAMAEGRREVWLRIQGMLHLDDKVLFALQDVDGDDVG